MTFSLESLARPTRSSDLPKRLLTCLIALAALVVAPPAVADWQAGVDAFESGDFDAAEAAFRQLAEAQPDWYGGHFMLGRTLLEMGKASDALPALQRALTLEARPEVALLLARTALDEDKASVARDALAGEPPAQLPASQQVAWLTLRARAAGSATARLHDLNAAIELAPQDLSVRVAAADAAVDAGRLDEAVRHLEYAKDHGSADEAVLVRLLKVRLAQSDALPNDSLDETKAAACLRSAEAAADLAAVTAKADHLSAAGRSYVCADDLGRAASYLGRALDAEPSWGRAHQLAQVQLKVQKWQLAEETLRPYLEIEGEGRAKVHQLTGRALEGQQRFLEAIPHYEIAGDQEGIAHAREGHEVLEEIKEQEQIEKDLKELEAQIGQLEDEEAGLR